MAFKRHRQRTLENLVLRYFAHESPFVTNTENYSPDLKGIKSGEEDGGAKAP